MPLRCAIPSSCHTARYNRIFHACCRCFTISSVSRSFDSSKINISARRPKSPHHHYAVASCQRASENDDTVLSPPGDDVATEQRDEYDQIMPQSQSRCWSGVSRSSHAGRRSARSSSPYATTTEQKHRVKAEISRIRYVAICVVTVEQRPIYSSTVSRYEASSTALGEISQWSPEAACVHRRPRHYRISTYTTVSRGNG